MNDRIEFFSHQPQKKIQSKFKRKRNNNRHHPVPLIQVILPFYIFKKPCKMWKIVMLRTLQQIINENVFSEYPVLSPTANAFH
jgi:hypothetical protein